MDKEWTDIVEGARRGDRRMMRLFYDRLAAMAYGLCLRYCDNPDQASELMQEGFVRVFEKIGQLSNPECAAGWVKKVMERTCLSYFRRRMRHRAVVCCEPPDDTAVVHIDPMAHAEVVKALQQLPDMQRLAFNLCEVEGYSFAEVANMLGVNEATVRSNLSRARHKLRELLSDYIVM